MLSSTFPTVILPFLFNIAFAHQDTFEEPLIEVYEGQNWKYSQNNVLFFKNTTNAKNVTTFTATLLTKNPGGRFTGGNAGVFDGYFLFPFTQIAKFPQNAKFTIHCNRRSHGTDKLTFLFGDKESYFGIDLEMILDTNDQWHFAHVDRKYGRHSYTWEKDAVNVTFSPHQVRIQSFDIDHSVNMSLTSLSKMYNLFKIVLTYEVDSVCTIIFANNTHYAIPTEVHRDPESTMTTTTTEEPVEAMTEIEVADAWALPPAVLPVAILLWIVLLGLAIGLGVLHRLHAERRETKNAVSPSEQLNTAEAMNDDVFK